MSHNLMRRVFGGLAACLLATSTYASATDWFDFDASGGQVELDIILDGVPARAMLDTGANINGINKRFLESHTREFQRGATIEVQGVIDKTRETRVSGVPVEIFGAKMDLDRLVPGHYGEADILLGVGFFNNFIVQIDYPGQRIRLIDRGALNMRKLANVKIKHEDNSELPIVQVDMNDEVKVWLKMDTGNSSGILLDHTIADSRGWLEKYDLTDGRLRGVSGDTVDVFLFNIPTMTFGPVELENVLVTVPALKNTVDVGSARGEMVHDGSNFRRFQQNAAGVLGFDVLKHFIVTLDYKGKRMHLGLPE